MMGGLLLCEDLVSVACIGVMKLEVLFWCGLGFGGSSEDGDEV